MDIKILRIEKDDLEIVKLIKLEALKDSPLAFDTSYEEAVSWSSEKWQEYFDEALDPKRVIYFYARVEGELAGYIRVNLMWKKKKRHIGDVDGLWVSDKYRGKGIARMLFEKIFDVLRSDYPHVIKLQLAAYEDQKPALALYKKLGFEIFGEFDKELYVDGKYYKQFMMDKFL